MFSNPQDLSTLDDLHYLHTQLNSSHLIQFEVTVATLRSRSLQASPLVPCDSIPSAVWSMTMANHTG